MLLRLSRMPVTPRLASRRLRHVAPPALASILTSILMPTSVHLPKPLLLAVDRRARALRISRNRLIVQALERELAETSEWSPHFFEELAQTDSAMEEAVDEMLTEVSERRSSKGPPKL